MQEHGFLQFQPSSFALFPACMSKRAVKADIRVRRVALAKGTRLNSKDDSNRTHEEDSEEDSEGLRLSVALTSETLAERGVASAQTSKGLSRRSLLQLRSMGPWRSCTAFRGIMRILVQPTKARVP